MARARLRVCLVPGCPNMQDSSRCDEHRIRKQSTKTTTQRGYGSTHQALREHWRPKVEAGHVDCARCGVRIPANAEWDLGHDDNDRTVYRGPEHQACNRRAKKRRPQGATPPRGGSR